VNKDYRTEKIDSYNELKRSISDLYSDGLSDQEANEATRNLIGFGKLLLEIKRAQL